MQGAAPTFGVTAVVLSSNRILAAVLVAPLTIAAFGASAQQPATSQPDVSVMGRIKNIPACQGLTQPECDANPDCMFVPQGVRKDGRPIPAYCRAKPR